MTTGLDIVNQALKKAGIIGIGNTASADDFQDALADLNDLITQWATKRWMVWSLLDLGFIADGNTNGYTVGPGGNYPVTPRPDHVEAAYVRQLQASPGLPVDTPLVVIQSREDYSRLSLKKNFISFPQYVFLDTAYPTALLFCYPWPNPNIYEIHILLKNVMPVIALDTVLDTWPAHYLPAMKFNLAQRLRQGYGKGAKPDPALDKLAADSLSTVKESNLQIPQLVMPPSLVRTSSGYNILSDQF
jgi:hypothetical protein